MIWRAYPFDEALFQAHALPSCRALLHGDLPAFSQALAGFAEAQATTRGPELKVLLDMAGPLSASPGVLAELAEDWGQDGLLPSLAARLPGPAAQRALLMLSGLLAFEDPDALPSVAKEALRSGRLPGLDAAESVFFGLVPLLEACVDEEGEPSPPPAEAVALGALLALEGEDWREVEPFSGQVHAARIWYKED